VCSDEDQVFIKCLRESKRYGAKPLLKMFPDRLWNLSGLQKQIGKIDETGGADRRPGIGPRALPAAARRLNLRTRTESERKSKKYLNKPQ